jgi:hypothetical protein
MRHVYVGRKQTKRGMSKKGTNAASENRLIPTRLAAEGAVCWLDHPWS